MKKDDVLMKKWCFGVSYAKPKEWLESGADGGNIVQRFPRYRTIALRVISSKKGEGGEFTVEAERYSSLTAKPKKVTFKATVDKKNGWIQIAGEKKPYHKVKLEKVTDADIPPVGSLITINKKHAIVTETGRNQLKVFVAGEYKTVNVEPGKIKWREDKILASLPQ